MLLRLLGTPALGEKDGSPLSLLSGKPAALLAYIAVMGPTPREKLVTLLWSDSGDVRGRNAFRQTLHRLRAIAGASLFADSKDAVSLTDAPPLEVDVEIFRAAAKAGRWTDAASLYTGEFLQGLVTGEQAFDEWLDAERRRLDAVYTGVLDRAAAEAAEAGDWLAALEFTRRLIATDPLNVAGCEREVRILIGAGRREEATLIAELHADLISREVGEDAAAPIRQLATRTRASGAPTGSRQPAREVRGPPPFLGRESELSRLLAMWSSTREEGGGLVLVTGQGGIGKTRLLTEFVSRARALGPARVASGKERGEWDIPYAGIADALRPLVRVPAAAGASRHLLVEAARLLPELRDRFDLPGADPLRDDAELLRFFEGVSAFIEAIAYDDPLYLQVDDFHRASPRSVQLAAYLADRLAGSAVVFAYALRTAEPDEPLPGHITGFLQRIAAARTDGARTLALDLSPLSEEQSADIARWSGDGGGGADGGESLSRLVENARGNPGRLLAFARGESKLAARALVPLRTILREKLSGSSQQERRLFVAAAMYGCVSPLRLLAAAAHISEASALEAALALEDAGLIVQDGLGVTPAHPDSFELALEESGPAGGALLAGWAADALAAEPDAQPGDLARLYVASGRGNDAAPHTRRAALHAAATGVGDAAASLLRRNLALPLEESARAHLEGLLRAVGGGPALIRGTVTPPRESPDPELRDAPPGSPAFATGDPAAAGAPLWRAWPQRYPWASTSAAALLAVSLVMGYRETRDRGLAGDGAFLADTLLVAEATGGRAARVFPITGALLPAADLGEARPPEEAAEWLDSLAPPWVNARVSPDGRLAAVERVTSAGTHVYLFTRDNRDTIPIATASGEWLALGWSPDGSWVLTLRAIRDASGDAAHLYAIEARRAGRAIAIDTGSHRLVTEAVWSPAGDKIGWTARNRETRQQDIYVAGLGEQPVNVSRGTSEDYGFGWSPDGRSVAFTSERDGRPQIYSVEVEPELRSRRLTNSPSADINPAFSPDGRQVAFESTRGGRIGVWLTTAVGGAALRVTPADRAFAMLGWRGSQRPRYIQRIDASGPMIVSVGDTFALTAQAVDQRGEPFAKRYLAWDVAGSGAEPLPRTSEDREENRLVLVARSTGRIRASATIGGWRSGEWVVAITSPASSTLREDFDAGPLVVRWQLLGRSLPALIGAGRGGTRGLAPMAVRPWASGALSRSVLILRPGLSLSAWVRAPFGEASDARSFTVALVDDDPQLPSDSIAPQPFKAAHITWAGDGDRLVFGAGREATSEPTRASGSGSQRQLTINVDEDGRVSFLVDGRLRWRSTAKLVEPGTARRVRVWLGGLNTGTAVVFDEVRAGIR